MKHLIIAVLITFVALTTVSAEEIKSVTISPDEAEVSVGDSTQFTAVVRDNEDAEVDTTVVWVVEGDIGTIDDNGLFSATSAGAGTVIAKLDAIADTALVTVTEAEVPVIESIEISPDEAEVNVGDSTQFAAVVIDTTDAVVDTTVVWVVEGDIGTIDELGLFIATTANTGLVIAKLDAIADTALVTVTEAEVPVIESIEISPDSIEISVGDSTQFVAVVIDTTGAVVDTTVVWVVEGDIGTIDGNGLFSATSAGEGTVIAKLDAVADTALVTVTEAEVPIIESIEISPDSIEVSVGNSTQFAAVVIDTTGAVVDTTVVWEVEGDIGTIDEFGLFVATTADTGLVIAKLDDIADSAIVIVTEISEPVIESVEVFPESQTVSVGDSIQFQAEVKDSEGEDIEAEVIWSLGDSTVASIDEAGLFIALAEGETKVIASVGEISGEAEVTVEEEIVLEPGVNTINVQRMKDDGKITRFGGTVVEGDTINIGGIPSPLNFMNGTKIYFPENSLEEDIIITFKVPKFGKKQKVKGKEEIVFPDSIITAVTFEVSVNDTVISPYPFEVPLEVSMPYKRGLLSKLGIEPEDLGMFYVTESGELVEEGITDIYLDEENNKIRGIITHFSDVALAQKTDAPTIAEEDDLPGGFSLSANYPNPFNPRTTISYSLPEASHVKITIYNLIGQHVKTLVNELKPVGTYYIVWDGTDASGTRVTSGLYIYQIKAGNFNQSRKLILMK